MNKTQENIITHLAERARILWSKAHDENEEQTNRIAYISQWRELSNTIIILRAVDFSK